MKTIMLAMFCMTMVTADLLAIGFVTDGTFAVVSHVQRDMQVLQSQAVPGDPL